jgi:hypothetical protein
MALILPNLCKLAAAVESNINPRVTRQAKAQSPIMFLYVFFPSLYCKIPSYSYVNKIRRNFYRVYSIKGSTDASTSSRRQVTLSSPSAFLHRALCFFFNPVQLLSNYIKIADITMDRDVGPNHVNLTTQAIPCVECVRRLTSKPRRQHLPCQTRHTGTLVAISMNYPTLALTNRFRRNAYRLRRVYQ